MLRMSTAKRVNQTWWEFIVRGDGHEGGRCPPHHELHAELEKNQPNEGQSDGQQYATHDDDPPTTSATSIDNGNMKRGREQAHQALVASPK